MSGRPYKNLAMRILENIRMKVPPEHCAHLGPCWIWKLSRCDKGYGRLTIRINGKPFGFRVHSVAYELFTGEEVPKSMTLDHLCFRKNCCNPRHLEQVSRSGNTWRYHRRQQFTRELLRVSLRRLRKATEKITERAAA